MNIIKGGVDLFLNKNNIEDESLKKNDIKALYAEVIEHKCDCNTNRSKHFKEVAKNQKIDKILSMLQSISSIFVIVFLTFFLTILNNEAIRLAIVCISAVSLGISLIQQIYGYREKSYQHWIAAQGYTQLYRELQFFHNQYSTKCDIELTRLAVRSLRYQLNDLNLTSPHISKDNWKDEDNIPSLRYCIEDYYKSLDEDYQGSSLKNEIDIVKRILFTYFSKILSHINIYLYGQSLNKASNDYDIAIIIQKRDIKYDMVTEKLVLIEVELLKKFNIYMDAYCYYADDFYSPQIDAFYINVSNGILIHKGFEPSNFSNIRQYTNKWIKKANHEMTNLQKLLDDKNYSMALLCIYYCYYYIFSHLLLKKGVIWNRDDELIRKFLSYYLESGEEEITNFDLNSFLRIVKYKNIALYSRSFQNDLVESHINDDKNSLILFVKQFDTADSKI